MVKEIKTQIRQNSVRDTVVQTMFFKSSGLWLQTNTTETLFNEGKTEKRKLETISLPSLCSPDSSFTGKKCNYKSEINISIQF